MKETCGLGIHDQPDYNNYGEPPLTTAMAPYVEGMAAAAHVDGGFGDDRV
jgi:hypothetical protein